VHANRARPVRVGLSGWNYAHWRNGVFYPPRLPASRWLEFYAERFDTVEVNSTFYRLPRRDAVAQLLVRERGLAIDLFEDPPFEAAPLDVEGRSRVVAAGTPQLCQQLAAALSA